MVARAIHDELLAFEWLVQYLHRLVWAAEQNLGGPTNAAALLDALLNAPGEVGGRLDEKREVSEVRFGLGDNWWRVLNKELFDVGNFLFLFSLQIEFIEKGPKWNDFFACKPRVSESNLHLNFI